MSLQVGTRVRVNDQYTKLPGDLLTVFIDAIFGKSVAEQATNPRVGQAGTVQRVEVGPFPYIVDLEDGETGVFAEGELDVIETAVDA